MEMLNFVMVPDEKTLSRHYFYNNSFNKLKIEFCNQGIDWAMINKDRDNLRRDRLVHHENHRNNPISKEETKLKETCLSNKKLDIFYQFKNFHKEIPIEVQHFQLRKNLKIMNDKELVYVRSHGIEKFNIITGKKQFLFIFEGQDIELYSKISCFDIIETENGDCLICCGKCDGEIILVKIKQEDYKSKALINEKSRNIFNYQSKFTSIRKVIAPSPDKNEIINHVKLEDKGKRLIIAANDCKIRIFDLSNGFVLTQEFTSVSATNHCSFSYDRSILVGYGDYEKIEVFDGKTTSKVAEIGGHFDFGFVVKFANNSNHLIASGNQDQSCKLWDLRKSIGSSVKDSSLNTLFGKLEAIGELSFSSDNKFLVFVENLDFLHIYDIKNDTFQETSYFGSTCGLAINPVNNNIYAAIADSSYHGIIEYDRIYPYATSISKTFF